MIKDSKGVLNKNGLYFSTSLHHLHVRKQACISQQKDLNQNRSQSPIDTDEKISTKSRHASSSSSYTSLSSYLKEFNLTNKDFFDLQQALKIIFHYVQSQIVCDHNKESVKQRLKTPYLHQQVNIDDQSSLPLYTDEYFIRNGLLNHNYGPEIHDSRCQSINLCYSNHSKPSIHIQNSSSSCYALSSASNSMQLASSLNISLPLALLSNQKHLFSALTNNFTLGKDQNNETKSMIIRRNKVQAWERDNSLRRRTSIAYFSIEQDVQLKASDHHQSTIVQTPSIIIDDNIIKTTEDFINKNSILLRGDDKQYEKILENKNIDDLFPMVKRLAPYIIICDAFHQTSNNNGLNGKLSINKNNEKSIQEINHRMKVSEKRTLTDVLDSQSIKVKRQSLLL
ncbi:unnamed protein product [Rotaria magnacalcarata]|uniref:Uncharacterized protein n=1 Tax=Rotaria magnacalcarata TaxID=392030 RepID=A0A819QES0_9BILA|nr:unnamed protein product [Rotaria magnacalcarata]CAF1380198.1 unnamed protein product [Rotaria magnacalcarata]CAF1918716.1 unnamed protein product [Rotaria magnacalcarata]CAF2119876.1 unnamed protein product [Rotaria magnacalcarata]CAF3962472.1 unnamed protein product [Rotaria magnacalcarata]